MNWKTEWKPLVWIIVVFIGCFFLPVETPRVQSAILESLYLVKWYAREHVLLCLIPAFFIAGAVAVFVSQNAVRAKTAMGNIWANFFMLFWRV